MRFKKTMLCVAIIVLTAAVVVNAGSGIEGPVSVDLKILQLPDNAGHGELSLILKPTRSFSRFNCDSLVVEVETKFGLVFLGAPKWTVPMDNSTEYTTVLNIDIPDNDTCGMFVHTFCGQVRQSQAIYFVTTGDTVETYGGHPRGRTPKPDSTWSQMERAKFTPEQLQKEFDFFLDLRHSHKNERSFAEKLLETLQPTDTANVYRVRTTIDNWITLWGDWRLKIIPVDYESLNAEYPRSPEDAPPGDSSETGDTLKSQSSLDKDPSLPYEGAITLERVTKLSSANTLPINETITYYIRLNNNTGTNMKGISNGFRVYSPDGADWSGTVGDTRSA